MISVPPDKDDSARASDPPLRVARFARFARFARLDEARETREAREARVSQAPSRAERRSARPLRKDDTARASDPPRGPRDD